MAAQVFVMAAFTQFAAADAASVSNRVVPDPDPQINAGRAHKRLRTVETLYECGAISTQELGRSAMDEANAVAAAIGVPVDAPNWVRDLTAQVQGIAAQVGGIEAQVRDLAVLRRQVADLAVLPRQVADLSAQVGGLSAQVGGIAARQQNSFVTEPSDRLSPVRGPDGELPDRFPATLHALNGLPVRDLRALLRFYGLNERPAATRLRRLKKIIGVPH